MEEFRALGHGATLSPGLEGLLPEKADESEEE